MRYWPHPVEIPLIRVPTKIPHNAITIFTDGCKIGGKVGAAAVIIKDDTLLHQYKYKLHERCSFNQAEQVAILKALEQIQNLQLPKDAEKIAVVNTDSIVTIETLQNRNKHYRLTGSIKKEIMRLEDQQWTVLFNLVKAHTGIKENEMADRLAKEAATEDIGVLVYDKIPKQTLITEGKEKEITQWQEQSTSSTKGAVSKLFFPHIKERIPISAEFMAMVTDHG